jgi:biopolymer transport protein TolQ
MDHELAATALEAVATPTLWSLVVQAGPVVKLVMAILLLASVWCWAVIIDKSLRIGRLHSKAKAFESQFWSGAPLKELQKRIGQKVDHPMAVVFVTAMEEWHEAPKSIDPHANTTLVERVNRVMSLTVDRELMPINANLSSLATIGSTAPFVGLFGTVWGIMGSFQSIAVTNNTTLAVVAPGIAEALLATALGLVAAIPAVIAYNRLSASVQNYQARLDSFADEFTIVLSRELEAARVR